MLVSFQQFLQWIVRKFTTLAFTIYQSKIPFLLTSCTSKGSNSLFCYNTCYIFLAIGTTILYSSSKGKVHMNSFLFSFTCQYYKPANQTCKFVLTGSWRGIYHGPTLPVNKKREGGYGFPYPPLLETHWNSVYTSSNRACSWRAAICSLILAA